MLNFKNKALHLLRKVVVSAMMGKYIIKSPHTMTLVRILKQMKKCPPKKRKCLSNYPPMIVKVRKSKYGQIFY